MTIPSSLNYLSLLSAQRISIANSAHQPLLPQAVPRSTTEINDEVVYDSLRSGDIVTDSTHVVRAFD